MNVKFRLTIEYLKKDIDLVHYLNQYGTGLFMVLHEKQDNYHYHGLLCLTVCIKTFRKHLNALLDPEVSIPKGMRPVSLSDKVNDANAYKAYCLYRDGHPISNIVVNDDLQELKSLWTKLQNKQNDKKSKLKLENDLQDIKQLIPPKSDVRAIVKIIAKYYLDNDRIVHVANCRQLAWTIYAREDLDALVDHILSGDDLYCHDNICHKEARTQMRQHLDDRGWCRSVESRAIEAEERRAHYLKLHKDEEIQ